MADITLAGATLGTALTDMLMADDIRPGSDVGYQLAKEIYLYHPLGAKMAEAPIAAAQSQKRKLAVAGAPEECILAAFNDEWRRLKCDRHIFSAAVTSRIYGIGAIVVGCRDANVKTNVPLPNDRLAELDIFFNVLDPLNASGSFSSLSDPNASDYQRFTTVVSQGVAYHPSRAVVLMNENPVYLAYEASTFGFTGRSVYQRALFPLKTFIQTMKTDHLITKKAGLLIAKLKAPGSIIDNVMAAIQGVKRSLLKAAQTDEVLSIDVDEDIFAVDLTNAGGASEIARKNCLSNAATAADMPAKWLNNETFVEGFGEGTEDAKNVAKYVDRIRETLDDAYRFMDNIVMRRAWSPAFYETVQARFPEAYGKLDYNTALYQWINAFSATWPSTLTEPDSEKIKVEDAKFKAVVAVLETLLPVMDPENQAKLLEWAVDSINESKLLFPNPLLIDTDTLLEHLEEKAKQAKDLADQDAQGGEAGAEGEPQPRKPEAD